MDLSQYSLTELRQLESKVAAEIRRKSESVRRNILKHMKKMATDEGLTLNDIISDASATENKPVGAPRKRGPKPGVRKTGKKPPKYFHPENPKIGWTGHGRKPGWVIDWLAQNKPIEALEKAPGK